jgi:cell wall-associated NlpC family hydrolase
MHYSVGLQVLLLASLSLFKPESPASSTKHKNHKTSKIVRVHKPHRGYSRGRAVTAISTGDTTPDELIAFAKTLKGIHYRFGSADPEKGFDCSGFVNYVFDHFGITIPRGSADFVGVNGQVDLKEAKAGDLILFTGTKTYRKRSAGHIGIIVSSPGEPIMFIHSTSGSANGVTETLLNDYYMGRFIKTIRLFPESDDNSDDHLSSETKSALPSLNN